MGFHKSFRSKKSATKYYNRQIKFNSKRIYNGNLTKPQIYRETKLIRHGFVKRNVPTGKWVVKTY